MGAAWCRKRAAAAQDSKSPLDRVIVRCVNQVYPPERNKQNGISSANGNISCDDSVDGADRERPGVSTPLSSQWQEVTLHVPQTAPVPPPRKKRQLHQKMGMTRSAPPEPPNRTNSLSPPRHKNISSVSLPNYDELSPEKLKRVSSKNLLSPYDSNSRAPSMSSVSEETVERVENYMRRCRSFGSMPEQLADRISNLDHSDSEDSWAGLDDWDLGVIEHCTHHGESPPVSPRSKLHQRPPRSSKQSSRVNSDAATKEDTTQQLPFLANEDDWFGLQKTPPPTTRQRLGDIPAEQRNGEVPVNQQNGGVRTEQQNGAKQETELNEVKKELQSIIFDFNRSKKMSTSSMEVLPTQPIISVKRKKISVASVTPPPSPEASDVDDNSDKSKLIASMVMNSEGTVDKTTHSTLLRILRDCQNIEGALEELGLEDLEVPGVHCSLQNSTGHFTSHKPDKQVAQHVTQSVDSGLDIHSSIHHMDDKSESTSTPTTSASNEVTEHTATNKPEINNVVSETKVEDCSSNTIVPQPLINLQNIECGLEFKIDEKVKPETTSADGKDEKLNVDDGCSSGRSSMTPSLSELEAALSDMLEKSTDDDERLPQAATTSASTLPVKSEPMKDILLPQENKTAANGTVRHAEEVH